MKYPIYIISLLLLLASSNTWAQLDRSKAPFSDKAPSFTMAEAKTFTLKNGLKVIFMENHKIPKVNFRIFIDRDPLFEGNTAGYTSMVGGILMAGTTTRNKNQISEEIDFMGARISAHATGVTGSCLTKHTNKVLTLMQDILLNPSFPESELALLKKQHLSGLESGKANVKTIGSHLKSTLLYGEKHPYGEVSTEESIEAITMQDITRYYHDYMRPNISYLVIVGDLKYKTAKKLAKKHFENWESKEIPKSNFPKPIKREQNTVAIAHKEGAVQTYLNLSHTIELHPGSPDIFAVVLLQSILGGGSDGRFYKNIREDKGFTYGAYCKFSPNVLIGNFTATAEVRNEVTDSATTEFLFELDRIQNGEVTTEELSLHKAKFMGSFARSLENPATFANYALNIQRYELPKNFYTTYLQNINKVTPSEILTAAKKYLHSKKLLIIGVGDRKVLQEKMKNFSTTPIKEYDYYAQEVSLVNKSIPEGITAQTIIDKYLTTINAKAWKKVNNFTVSATVKAGPMPLAANIYIKNRSKLNMSINMGGMTVSQQIYDGKTAYVTGPQGKVEASEDQVLDYKLQVSLVEELLYQEMKLEPKLREIVTIDNVDCYAVEIPLPTLKVNYYSIESGLKIKDTSTQKTPQGAIITSNLYSDYQKVGNGLFPHVVKRLMGQQPITLTVTNTDITTEIDDKIFRIK